MLDLLLDKQLTTSGWVLAIGGGISLSVPELVETSDSMLEEATSPGSMVRYNHIDDEQREERTTN
jgi:hypothetical protein